MAQLNITERRLPQDGRIQWPRQAKIDIRISTCPMLYGEKIVLRILDVNKIDLDISSLGFTAEQEIIFRQALANPQGLIFVTGPTGSGKTITLYAALQHLNSIEKNISSIEDPVEIELAGINQIHVNPKIGLEFSTALRAFLRQDPDIIMIGEIRDAETATIAIQAAQTGHLVLATLHTNSAAEAHSRLQAMGIKEDYLTSALTLVVAQRLVRKLCVHCKKSQPEPKAVGCEYCHQGYNGRIGVFECLSVNKNEWMSLWEAGLEKIKQGITDHDEINRTLPITL